MRLRQLVLACGFSSFVLSQYASALGLGEVKLKSTLNEPLNAEIKLLDTRDLTADQILVALASPADFERNNVERLYFYTEFQFEVVLNSSDGPKVLVTSRNPVREPYLNFLIEARWTAGRLLREYTLLMDLPTFEQDSVQAVTQPARVSTRSTAQSTSTAPSTTTSTSEPTSSYESTTSVSQRSTKAAPSISGDEYEIRDNDTLWEIALGARSDRSVSVHQAMMALYEANPDAFINGNINLLRKGKILKIPSADEMKSLSKQEAVTQFAQADSGDTSMGAQLNASRRTSSTHSESTEVSGRVKLAAPSSSTAGAGLGSGANDGAGKALEAELAATLEELDKSKAENSELNSRVKDLEAQINTMQRLVDVSNEKLRSLQVTANQQAAEAAKADAAKATTTEATKIPDVKVAEPEAHAESSVAAESVVAAVESSAAVSSVVAASSASAVVQPKKITPPPAPEPTMVDSLVANAPWIGLGVLGLAGAGFFVYRRRKAAEMEQETEQDDIFAMDPVDDVEEQHYEEEQQEEALDEPFEPEEEEAPAVAETGDVVGEADIYIAYGKLDQAEEMLLNGLQKDPNSVDIRMKLLEVYSQQQNASGFDKHYTALLPLATGAVLARAAELREHIQDAGDFESGAANGGLPHEESSLDDFALDDFQLDDDSASQEASAPLTDSSELSGSNSRYDLDLSDELSSLDDIESPNDTVIRAPSSQSAEVVESPSFDMVDDEFTLDLDDADTELSFETDAAIEAEADDLSELSLALDDLDADVMPQDVTVSAPAVEDEFSFNFDEDETVAEEPVADTASEVLDVAADDFNLDLDAGGVDLAALDHEMESLDVDFDDDELSNATNELDTASFDVDADDDFAQLDAAFEESADMGNDTLELDESDDLNLDEVELDLGDFDASDSLSVAPEVSAPAAEIADDDVFNEALSDFSSDSSDLNVDNFSSDASDLSEDDMDAELDFLADADEAATKLDLARAYMDMGDTEGAKDILAEVMQEGNEAQRNDALELLGRIDA